MKAKTFEEWHELGYWVRTGEKASGRNAAGKPTFTRDQVDEDAQFDYKSSPRSKRD